MSYEINKSDGTPVSIADGAIDTTQFTIGLVGKNVSGYGAEIAKTQIHLLEHFSNSSAPANPTEGQLWWDSGNSAMKVYNGSAFIELATGSVDLTETGDILPLDNCGEGAGGSDIGSPSKKYCNVYAVTFNGVATSARYADMAERYESDTMYTSGTVVKIGGEKEITQTTESFDSDVFGVISENPGLMLNSEAGSDVTHPYVALAGRVKVKVVGKVKKGQRLRTSSVHGHAEAWSSEDGDLLTYQVVGRALEDKVDEGNGEILIVVGAR